MNVKHRAIVGPWGLIFLAAISSATACSHNTSPAREAKGEATPIEKDPVRLSAIGEAWAANGDPGRAAEYFELAIKSGGDEHAIVRRLLTMLIRDKQYQAATLTMENYLRRHPGDLPARLVGASLYASLGDFGASRREFETILRFEPSNSDAHYSLAVLLRDEDGDLLQADAHFREYIRLSPEGAHAEEARGLLLNSTR